MQALTCQITLLFTSHFEPLTRNLLLVAACFILAAALALLSIVHKLGLKLLSEAFVTAVFNAVTLNALYTILTFSTQLIQEITTDL